ncbi:hypothetical protein EDC01DRAFT_629282 [Geopyxis carbonaria]|nr:hypothetical protein EDC01DRAFT_629282 [Geopyxis carbonaria]
MPTLTMQSTPTSTVFTTAATPTRTPGTTPTEIAAAESLSLACVPAVDATAINTDIALCAPSLGPALAVATRASKRIAARSVVCAAVTKPAVPQVVAARVSGKGLATNATRVTKKKSAGRKPAARARTRKVASRTSKAGPAHEHDHAQAGATAKNNRKRGHVSVALRAASGRDKRVTKVPERYGEWVG